MTDPAPLAARADLLRSLQVPGTPLVLPNAWDAASARAFVHAGFPVVATSSAAVAESLGHRDGEHVPVDEMFAAVARVAASVDAPVTADLERGFGLEPSALVERISAAGIVGCNLEDSDPGTAAMVPAAANADRLAAVRAAAAAADQPLVLNARIDVFVRNSRDQAAVLDDGVERARRYLDAGADAVYPILLTDEDLLGSFVEQVDAPVNAYYRSGGPSVARLAELGVARITFGSGLHAAAMAHVAGLAQRLHAGDDPFAG